MQTRTARGRRALKRYVAKYGHLPPGNQPNPAKKQARQQARQQRLAAIQGMEQDLSWAAEVRGLELRVSEMECSKTAFTYHWMFNERDTGKRVLDYWPTKGTWWSRATDERGTAADPWEALEVASKLA